jgi:hypothetical protein
MSRLSGSPFPETLANNSEIAAEHSRMTIDEISRAISMSEIRRLSFDELLRRIERLWEDPQAGEIVYRACEEELSENQFYALAESVRRLADAIDLLPSPQKASPDRSVRRMLARMPAEIAAPVAEQWLEHKRKFRREVAYHVLRQCGLTPASGPRLLEIFNRTGDRECLKLIARYPVAIGELDVPSLLDEMDDDYWRMRLVQAALISDKAKATALANSHPHEFVRAVGRLREKTLTPELRELFNKHSGDLSFLSLYAWALGQLGAHAELAELKDYVETLRKLAPLPMGCTECVSN